MSTFAKLNNVKNIVNSKTKESVTIIKVQKVGTKRVFFVPEVNGKRINSILFAKLYNAESLANQYLKRNQN